MASDSVIVHVHCTPSVFTTPASLLDTYGIRHVPVSLYGLAFLTGRQNGTLRYLCAVVRAQGESSINFISLQVYNESDVIAEYPTCLACLSLINA